MKYTLIFTYTFVLFVLNSIPCRAQDFNIFDTLEISIPPLSYVLDAAILHSPLLKALNKETDIINEEIKIQKGKWLDNIYFEGVANYGMFDQVVLNGETSDGVISSGLISRSEQSRYYAGVSVKLPISAISSRKNEINKSYHERQKTNFEIEDAKRQINQKIIEEYYMLKYLDESTHNFFAIYQTLEIAFIKTEKDLLSGKIDLNEFAQISTMVGKAREDYFKTKNSFYAQYYKLQDLAGIKF